jgi:hypothetical protein
MYNNSLLQTQKSYNWITPKICRDGVQGAVSLPTPGDPEPCPPCNPGMEMKNNSCQFCPANQQSDGMGQCHACPGSTAPEMEIVYKWWNNLPVSANITAYCLSLTGKFILCQFKAISLYGYLGALNFFRIPLTH